MENIPDKSMHVAYFRSAKSTDKEWARNVQSWILESYKMC